MSQYGTTEGASLSNYIPVSERYVHRASDTTIGYTVRGDLTASPVLVFVHGWGCNRTDFAATTQELTDYAAISIDLAEHGESRSERDNWSIAEFARDVVAVLDQEAIRSCMIVGHSMGGAVAVDVANMLGSRVTEVVVLDSLHYLSLFQTMPEDAIDNFMALARSDFPSLVRTMVDVGSPEGFVQELKDKYFNQMVVVRQPAGVGAFEGILRWDLDRSLGALVQPLTIFAVRALITQEAVDKLQPVAQMVYIESGSHHFPKEDPVRTAHLIRRVLQQTRTSSP
ncbi:MAG: alpha/beta hydrolase [Hyphomicrobiales bacterium]|nr:MAG: alpha/beta hydrolase [Hyphomicrobiales bacterium]